MVGVFVGTMVAGLAGADVFDLHYGWAFSSFLLLWWALGPGARFFAPTAWWVRILVFAGTISYSFYLLHFPFFRLAGAAWVSAFGSKPESFLVPTLGTLLVVPLAWIFFRLVERPSHKLGQRAARTLEGRPA
jgi:peptidoglycan/LPS O-acetylase OafA/YrhL